MTTPPSNEVPDRAGLPDAYELDAAFELTPAQVKSLLDAGDPFTLLDVRMPAEVATAAVDGATVVPMPSLPHRLSELSADRGGKVVVFCHAGVRSMAVTRFLREAGFTDCWSMAGGIDAWSLGVDPSVPRY